MFVIFYYLHDVKKKSRLPTFNVLRDQIERNILYNVLDLI